MFPLILGINSKIGFNTTEVGQNNQRKFFRGLKGSLQGKIEE